MLRALRPLGWLEPERFLLGMESASDVVGEFGVGGGAVVQPPALRTKSWFWGTLEGSVAGQRLGTCSRFASYAAAAAQARA